MALLSLKNVSLAFGGPQLLDHVDLQVERRDRICLLGRNGAGKSTLLKVLNGEMPVDSGDLDRQQGIKTALLTQAVPDQFFGSVRDVLLAPVGQGGPVDAQRVEYVLSLLKIDGDAAVETFSGGMKRKVLLGRALCTSPDVLLLDEPTNHLDIESIVWLEDLLLRLGITLIFVSHDRMFARRLATRIVELDRGRLYDFHCGYDDFLQRREEFLNAEQKAWARFDQKLAEEEMWIRKGIKARRTRNEGRVRALVKMREERASRRQKTGQVQMRVQQGERSGQLVIEATDLCFSYDQSPIIDRFSTRIMRGDRVGVVGANGAGKSTLLKLLLGQMEPQTGRIRHGTNLQVVYFDQLREQLDDAKTVQENIVEGTDQVLVAGQPRHVLGYLQDFLFTPERSRTPVRVLSGGERNRLLLARLFLRPANVLVLDEPTNDLDIETLDLLEEVIANFQGTVLLVSHDRAFLDNLVTSCLICEGGGRVRESVGGYQDWLLKQKDSEDAPPKKTTEDRVVRSRSERPRRLSFKEKRELEMLPEQIEALDAELETLHETLADPALYQQGGGQVVNAAKLRLGEIEQQLAELYQRWQELDAIPQ